MLLQVDASVTNSISNFSSPHLQGLYANRPAVGIGEPSSKPEITSTGDGFSAGAMHEPVDSLVSAPSSEPASPISLLHKPGGTRAFARKTMLMALMVSSVASGFTGVAHANDNVAQKLADPGPVAEQQAEVASDPSTDPTVYNPFETAAPTETGSSAKSQGALQTLKNLTDASYEGEVGGYKLTVEAFGSRVRARPRVKLDEVQLRGSARIDLANTELARTREVDGWQISDGAYGRVRFTGEYRTGVEKGSERSESFEHGVALEAGLFRQWSTSLSENVTFEHRVEGGYSYNLTHGQTAATVGARQTFKGEGEWKGQDFTWTAEARQRVSFDSSRETDALKGEFELYAGVGKSFPMKVFGRDTKVEVSAGPRVKVDTGGDFSLAPASRLRVRF